MSIILLKDLLKEGVTYRVPTGKQSKMHLLYDFYALSYIITSNYDPSNKGFSGAFNQPEDLQDDIDHAKNVLLPYLKKHMLEVLFFCICAEIRHCYDEVVDGMELKKIVQKYPVFKAYRENRNSIMNRRSSPFSTSQKSDLPKVGDDRNLKTSSSHNESYIDSWRAAKQAIKSSGSSMALFVDICKKIYKLEWETDYGGKPWENICEAWERLSEAKNFSEISVAVDHIYDLHHNTGFALNKIKEYRESWVARALDHKAEITDIRELLPKCSGDMRRLAEMAFRASGVKKRPFSPDDWDNKIWQGGTWTGGECKVSRWEGGTWENGTWKGIHTNKRGGSEMTMWEDGLWKNGVWERGTWIKGVWKNGFWKNGFWSDGVWENGTWIDGLWKGGTWKNGRWQYGKWYAGQWLGGVWENGFWFNGTWEDGTWEDGTWHSGTWKGGIWKDGIFDGGIWKGGTWKAGRFRGGVWEGGTWEGGTWEYGNILVNGGLYKSSVSPDKFVPSDAQPDTDTAANQFADIDSVFSTPDDNKI